MLPTSCKQLVFASTQGCEKLAVCSVYNCHVAVAVCAVAVAVASAAAVPVFVLFAAAASQLLERQPLEMPIDVGAEIAALFFNHCTMNWVDLRV